ncbi:MAG: hypothetical protein QM608_02955 [Caulobacter sp.]
MSSARQAQPVEPDTSIRAELAGQIASAQAQLEAHIEELRSAASASGDAGALVQAEGQLGRLGNLAKRLEQAGPGALSALKAEVLAASVAAQTVAQQTRTAAAAGQASEVALHAAQADAHRVVDDFTHDFYDRKIFDKDLRFTSDEDERAYREREEARRREIEKAQALGTPEGELRALQLAKEQLLNAGAHGADKNPDFQKQLDQITAAQNGLEAILGPKTAQKAAATVSPDPLDAVVPTLDSGVQASLAEFRAAGIVATEVATATHGVTIDARLQSLVRQT